MGRDGRLRARGRLEVGGRLTRRPYGEARYDLICERGEPPLGDERRVQIAHRAGGGVARVLEQRLAGFLTLAVDALELRARQEHLTAYLYPARDLFLQC